MEKILERIFQVKGDKTSSAFARLLGMHQQTVDNYLSGRRKMSLEFISTICCKCNVSCDWLLGFAEEKKGTAAPLCDLEYQGRIINLEQQVLKLKGENEGMRYALDAMGIGVSAANKKKSSFACA